MPYKSATPAQKAFRVLRDDPSLCLPVLVGMAAAVFVILAFIWIIVDLWQSDYWSALGNLLAIICVGLLLGALAGHWLAWEMRAMAVGLALVVNVAALFAQHPGADSAHQARYAAISMRLAAADLNYDLAISPEANRIAENALMPCGLQPNRNSFDLTIALGKALYLDPEIGVVERLIYGKAKPPPDHCSELYNEFRKLEPDAARHLELIYPDPFPPSQ